MRTWRAGDGWAALVLLLLYQAVLAHRLDEGTHSEHKENSLFEDRWFSGLCGFSGLGGFQEWVVFRDRVVFWD